MTNLLYYFRKIGRTYATETCKIITNYTVSTKKQSRTLRPVNVLLVFSNNIQNGNSDIIDIKRQIMACP